MSNLFQIIEGWGKYISGQIPQYAIDRAKHCAGCRYAQKSTFEMLLKDKHFQMVEGLVCSVCSCPIITKIRAKESECPKGIWK